MVGRVLTAKIPLGEAARTLINYHTSSHVYGSKTRGEFRRVSTHRTRYDYGEPFLSHIHTCEEGVRTTISAGEEIMRIRCEQGANYTVNEVRAGREKGVTKAWVCENKVRRRDRHGSRQSAERFASRHTAQYGNRRLALGTRSA
jgi:hypothetical protein